MQRASQPSVTSTDAAEGGAEAPPGPAFRRLDLGPHHDNTIISGAASPSALAGSPLAGDPPPTGAVTVAGVPFAFPAGGGPDNVRCDGQLVRAPTGAYDWLYLLGAAWERPAEGTVVLHFAGGAVDHETLRLSDFWAEAACFGELAALTCRLAHTTRQAKSGPPATIWRQRLPVTRRAELAAVRLPRDIAMHVFAMTLAGAPASTWSSATYGRHEHGGGV